MQNVQKRKKEYSRTPILINLKILILGKTHCKVTDFYHNCK